MSAADTRNEAYDSLDDLTERQAQVLRVLARGPMSNAVIAERLGLPINCVTGRVRELVQDGRVRAAYKDLDARTGRRVTVWGLVE